MITNNELKLSVMVLGVIVALVSMLIFTHYLGINSGSIDALVVGMCSSLITVVTRKIFGNDDNGDEKEGKHVRPRKKTVAHDE